MAGTSRLNKSLWTNIERLKLYAKGDGDAKFILEKNPFDDDDDEEQDEYIIIGRVIPEAGIYKEDGFRIEMKITSKYPREPPEVRFLTSVYHPNIEIDGVFSHQLLSNGSKWRMGTTLVDLVKVIVRYLNEPDPDYAVNFDMGKEYIENREEFIRKACEIARRS